MTKNLIVGFFIFLCFFSLSAKAENVEAEKVTVYVIPSVSDNKILPISPISLSYVSDNISVKGSPDEFEPASFVIYANQDINSMVVETTNLSGSEGIIPKEDLDIRIVKCWYQGDHRKFGGLTASGRYLTPELLLKDDSLIKVTGEDWTNCEVSNPKGNNYLKLTNGSLFNISSDEPQDWVIPTSNCSVKDTTTLQPVTIQKGHNKQFWITVHIPNNANAGNYSSTITLKIGSKIIRQLRLNLQVLPIVLSKPNVEYSIYYRGIITANGSVSSEEKTVKQYTAEMQNIFEHGVTNPTIYGQPEETTVRQMLQIRQEIGLNNTNVYYLGLGLDNSAGWISWYKSYVTPYGVKDLYVYAPDEQDLNDSITKSKIDTIHETGCKVMAAQSLAQATSIANIIDLAVVSKNPCIDLANMYHKYNHKIYSYANPQVVPEYPRLFRMNYGLLLWQRNYDGTMDYAYQHSFGNIWNDFDSDYRDHVFAYPTMNGVIDTIQWEGFREGVDDMRYLATLQDTIRLAKIQEKDTLAAENYLASLKNSDLSSQDLDETRGQMINYTLSLQNQLNSTSLSDDRQNNQCYLVAAFAANKVYGKVPLTITFADTSTGSPTAWNWSFGDRTYSTVQNPTHNYSTAGNYTVMLTINNSAASNTTTKSNYIEVTSGAQKPIIYFWGSRVSGIAPLTIRFTDASTGLPTAWKWNFGDGSYSTVQNPKHTYSKAGNYTVTLKATNSTGSGTKTRSNYINVR